MSYCAILIYPHNLGASFEHKPKEYLLGAYGQILVIMPLIMALVTVRHGSSGDSVVAMAPTF